MYVHNIHFVFIIVIALPNITMQPTSVTFKAGDLNVLAMSCRAVGMGPIYFEWQKYQLSSNSWIQPSHRAVSITSPNLEFSVITEEDKGTYRCVVTNNDGSVISNNATIFVFGKFYVKNTYILVSNEFLYTCRSTDYKLH